LFSRERLFADTQQEGARGYRRYGDRGPLLSAYRSSRRRFYCMCDELHRLWNSRNAGGNDLESAAAYPHDQRGAVGDVGRSSTSTASLDDDVRASSHLPTADTHSSGGELVCRGACDMRKHMYERLEVGMRSMYHPGRATPTSRHGTWRHQRRLHHRTEIGQKVPSFKRGMQGPSNSPRRAATLSGRLRSSPWSSVPWGCDPETLLA
jgi:hypothetical protein